MFRDEDLINHIETNNSIKLESLVVAEWNQNILTNIENYGNYRWRKNSASVAYNVLFPSYDPEDLGNTYTGGLESKSISQYRVEGEEPLIFLNDEQERQIYYSLKDCFNPFRPRSGINKMLFFDGKYVDSIRSGRRPRYYFSSRKDQFKYWTSYRKDNGLEVGVSSLTPVENRQSVGYEIHDAAPFVIYKEEVAANRIVVKMQTNLADPNDLGIDRQQPVSSQIRVENSLITDPLQDLTRSTIPKRWRIQYLDSNNNWIDAASFDETSARSNGDAIVPWDGYVELAYGIKIPEKYRSNFNFIDYISSSAQLPSNVIDGQAYIMGASNQSSGDLYIWDTASQEWNVSEVVYEFSLLEDNDTKMYGLLKKMVNPDYYLDSGNTIYKEFAFIKGLRVAVETMFAPNKTFDLIEMSPRLKVDMTQQVIDYSIFKNLAATDYSLPVGGLAADTGTINISNDTGAFTESNIYDKETKTGSIIANILRPQIKFDFYEMILDVGGYDKFVPLKTLYSENSTIGIGSNNSISLSLRDALFRFESAKAASVFIQNSTLTMAVAIMLDNIGFGNYIFKGITTANDPVIPFFFVEPDASVAEILQRLAIATQAAMFFDEYNNFVIMPKEYLMPDVSIRDTDEAISERLINLYGQKEGTKNPNIESITNYDTAIVNDGQINYTTRYIQREISKLEQAQLDLRDRTYSYKSSILWEAGQQDVIRTINQPVGKSGFALGAVALNTDLSNVVPYVENNEIKENIIDVGADSVYWLPRFQGYLYANSEIIRYDAQEYSVSGKGNVWITNNNEYQKYLSKLPFNGQMWLTGRLRIYVEPFYEELPGEDNLDLEVGVTYKNGQVKSHGRGQFGTDVVYHHAGINAYWKDQAYRKSFRMDSKYLFSTTPTDLITYPFLGPTLSSPIGEDLLSKGKSEITDKIANFMRKSVRAENNYSTANQTQATVQASALVMTGPTTFTPPAGLESTGARDILTYVYKDFTNDYKHVGTRMRIVGSRGNTDREQNPLNATSYFNTTSTAGQSSELSGASGGIGYMVDKTTNSGYYFEIAALSKEILTTFSNSASVSTNFAKENEVIHNVIFYKVLNQSTQTAETGKQNIAVPVKLWGTTTQILIDEGNFVGMDRLMTQDNPTVYDLGIESERIDNNTVKFYLYLNNALIATVIDSNALPNVTTNNTFTTCLFVRSSSRCMFENIYALKNRANQTQAVTAISLQGDSYSSAISRMVGGNIKVSESIRKYALPGIVQSTYLSSIGAEKPPGYDIYFEEFGTIMRECFYFNIKYDQAYPALVAQLVPSFSAEKTYTVSGFLPGSYGAEFLIFNATDKAISLSEDSANKLMIQGITFTQNISNVLTVDDYFRKVSNLSDPIVVDNVVRSPDRAQKVYDDIRTSRSIYGEKSFALDSVYIQDEDSARDLMSWIINKTLKPRKIIEVDTFGTSYVQIGDIIKINYHLPEGSSLVDNDKRFVVVSAKYDRSFSNIKNQLRLLEI